MGKNSIRIFGTHRINFLFLCTPFTPLSTDSSNVQEFKNKIYFVTDFITVYTKSVGLQVPGNIRLLYSLNFILFPLHSQTSALGFEKRQICIVPIRIFFFARRYANFPYNVFYRRHKSTSGHPSPH